MSLLAYNQMSGGSAPLWGMAFKYVSALRVTSSRDESMEFTYVHMLTHAHIPSYYNHLTLSW